jgi:uncharacterized membrane protein YdjX (TVP38/TMEM64 family)
MSQSLWGTITTLVPRRRFFWLLLFGCVLLGVLWWLRSVIDLTPSGLRSLLVPLGWWGALCLVAGIAVILVVPVVPATVLQVGAGLVFGPWFGFALTLLGDLIGSLVGFFVARYWGEKFLRQRLSPAEQTALDDLTARITPTGMLLLRVLPGPAYTVVSFAAGCSRMRWWHYLIASLVGVAPGLLVLTVAGDLSTRDPLAAVGIAVGFVIGMAALSRFFSPKR